MPSLLIDIGANIARLQQDVAKAQRTVDGFAKSAGTAFKAIAGYMTAGAIGSAIMDVTRAYMDQERALNKMANAMKNQGDYSKAALNDMEAYSSKIQETSTVADDAALSAMANLKSYGMLNEEVKRATQVSVDFAAAKKEEGMTVVTASELIGKAYAGNTSTLSRYGIVIDSTLKGADRFEAVMRQLQDRFSGAAQAELETYEGKIAQLKNTFGDAKENVGQLALEFASVFGPEIKAVAEQIKQATDGLRMFFDVSKRGMAEKKRMAIVEEMEELERLMKNGPSWWDRLKAGTFAESGDLPENTLAARVYGSREEWAARYADLQQELQKAGATIHGFDVEDRQTAPGGKRTISTMGGEDGSKERDKWLTEYLKGVDRAMKAEQERSELVGELYAMDWQWQIEANEKRLEQEQIMNDASLYMAAERYRKEGELRDGAFEDLISLSVATAERMEQNFSDLFFDVMTWKFTSLKDFAESVFQSMARMAADYLGGEASKFLFSSSGLFSSLLTTTPQVTSGLSSILSTGFAYGFHQGGVVGETHAPARWVPAETLSGARRYHGGLAPDEMPAILQKGETVLPKGEAAQQAQPPMNIVINAVDAASFAQLASRNPQAIVGPIMEALQKGGQLRNMIRGVV